VNLQINKKKKLDSPWLDHAKLRRGFATRKVLFISNNLEEDIDNAMII
jgi:hypothetical protein